MSRTLRDIQSSVIDESVCLNKRSDIASESISSSAITIIGHQGIRSSCGKKIQKAEEIAQYYIERASTETKQLSSNIGIESVSRNMPRVSDVATKVLESTYEIAVDDVHPTTENKLDEMSSTYVLDDCYAVSMKLANEFEEVKKRVENSTDQKTLRILTKRTVIEKVTVESKKTASDQELLAVSGFLCRLLIGQSVIGYGGKIFQLCDIDFMRYGIIVTIESYMEINGTLSQGIVERDPSLVLVISRILMLISCTVPNFESVLLGKLLAASHLLTMDEEKCFLKNHIFVRSILFAEHLLTREDRRFALLSETCIIKLFFHLHYIGLKSGNAKHFTLNALWELASSLTNRNPKILATAIMLSEIVTSGTSHMKEICSQKWLEFLNKIAASLLPRLEMDVDKSVFRRSIGEDTILSSLRHSLQRYLNE
ncbi:hypothetical protein DICVIV_07698 [Dictyocaulus viviparus]|uniref:Nucleoporin GLE1 n=1 Tax=Dictyocaulus viviparus TaxID=29172 RepID=A0A0D8XR82_DICVI|nr:hypothetical protein DICVIV_07698 [Dictyocaulus viviparus]